MAGGDDYHFQVCEESLPRFAAAAWHHGWVTSPRAAVYRPLTRRTFFSLTALVGCGAALSSCTKLLPPKPDAAVEALLTLANRDRSLDSTVDNQYFAEFIAIRAEQAQVLEAEIARACGTHPNGEAPENCPSQPTATTSEPAPKLSASPENVSDIVTDSRNNQLLSEALDDADNLSSDYAAKLAIAVDAGLVLAARQAGAQAKQLLPAPALVSQKTAGGKQELRAAVEAEYAAIYGLTIASAYLDANHRELAETYADMHRSLRDLAITLLNNVGEEVPTPPAGYDAIDSAANLRTDTANFVSAVLGSTSDAWRMVIEHSRSGPSRLFALQAAGISTAQAAAILDNSTAALPGLD